MRGSRCGRLGRNLEFVNLHRLCATSGFLTIALVAALVSTNVAAVVKAVCRLVTATHWLSQRVLISQYV